MTKVLLAIVSQFLLLHFSFLAKPIGRFMCACTPTVAPMKMSAYQNGQQQSRHVQNHLKESIHLKEVEGKCELHVHLGGQVYIPGRLQPWMPVQ